jgi:hypothetical protein
MHPPRGGARNICVTSPMTVASPFDLSIIVGRAANSGRSKIISYTEFLKLHKL